MKAHHDGQSLLRIAPLAVCLCQGCGPAPDGIWIATTVGTAGTAGTADRFNADSMVVMHVTTHGNKASVVGEHIAPLDPTLGGRFDADSLSDPFGELVGTGLSSSRFKFLRYGTKKDGVSRKLVYILVVSGSGQLQPDGTIKSRYRLLVYTPDQDANSDGIPDNGQTPAHTLGPFSSTSTKLSVTN